MKNDPQFLAKRRVVEKLKDFYYYVRKNNGQIGTKQRGIELNFNISFGQLKPNTEISKPKNLFPRIDTN